jgi:hypothetical protein
MINLPVCYAVATILDIQSTKNAYLIMEDLRHIPSRFWFQMVQCILQLLILNYFPHGALSNKNNRGSMWGDLIIVRSFLPWCLFWCCCPFTRALLSTLIRCIRSGDSPVLTVTKHSFWWLTSTHGYKTFHYEFLTHSATTSNQNVAFWLRVFLVRLQNSYLKVIWQ